MTKTIESHYNSLRNAARYARSIVGRDWGVRSISVYHSDLATRVIARANELATADWPRRRSEIAASGAQMPDGPVRHGSSGYGGMHLDASSIFVSRRSITGDVDYAVQALESLRPELEREACAAEAAFEAYRRAVEQGVAIAPAE